MNCDWLERQEFIYETEIPKEIIEQKEKRYKKIAETYLAVIEKAAKEAGVECKVVYERNDYPYKPILGHFRKYDGVRQVIANKAHPR